MIRRMSVVGVALAALLQSASASAADTVVVLRVPVAYGDLNLGTADGQSAMRARLAAAASQACGGNPAFHTHYRDAALFVRADFEKCRAAAQEGAVSALRMRGVRLADGR